MQDKSVGKSKFLLIILLLVSLLVALILYFNLQAQKGVSNTSAIDIGPVTEYKDATYPVSFSYPLGWHIRTLGIPFGNQLDAIIIGDRDTTKAFNAKCQMEIDIFSNPKILRAEDWFQSYLEGGITNNMKDSSDYSKKVVRDSEKLKVAALKNLNAYNPPNNSKIYITSKGKYAYILKSTEKFEDEKDCKPYVDKIFNSVVIK